MSIRRTFLPQAGAALTGAPTLRRCFPIGCATTGWPEMPAVPMSTRRTFLPQAGAAYRCPNPPLLFTDRLRYDWLAGNADGFR